MRANSNTARLIDHNKNHEVKDSMKINYTF